MSSNYFFQSLTFRNYRVLKNLEIPSLCGINLIGGNNGTGKSSLLEGLFFLLDRRGPLALMRPFAWRKLGMNGKSSLEQLFYKLDPSRKIEICAHTTDGFITASLRFDHPSKNIELRSPVHSAHSPMEMQQSLGESFGLDMQFKIDGKDDDAIFAFPMPDGISVHPYRMGNSKIPAAFMVSPATRNSPQDDATRFSQVVKQNRLPELISILSTVRPTLKDIHLLQDGASPTLYAQMQDGDLYPFPMLGEGVQTILSITLSMMNLPGGVIFLDEFESAIHYSVLPEVWEKIAVLAEKYSCQVFAATHSRECIRAALEGTGKIKKILQYIRLENDTTGVSAICYDDSELSDAIASDWEVR